MIEESWLVDPSQLFNQLTLIPTSDMTLNERINTLTRIILVVSLLIFLITRDVTATLIFLVLGIILVLIVRSVSSRTAYSPINSSNIREYLPCPGATAVPVSNLGYTRSTHTGGTYIGGGTYNSMPRKYKDIVYRSRSR